MTSVKRDIFIRIQMQLWKLESSLNPSPTYEGSCTATRADINKTQQTCSIGANNEKHWDLTLIVTASETGIHSKKLSVLIIVTHFI